MAKKLLYSAPEAKIILIAPREVICKSGNITPDIEDIYYGDGGDDEYDYGWE